MKTHLTKVSLALLSAAFLLGCQDQGSAPTAPEAQPTVLAAFTAIGSDTYTLTYKNTGDVYTVETSIAGVRGPGKKSRQVQVAPQSGALVLSDALKDRFEHLDGFEKCFTEPLVGFQEGFAGLINPDKKIAGGVTGLFWFKAKGTDGTTDFNYHLRVAGTVTAGTFPPDPTKTTEVTWNGVGAGEMNTEGSGKGKKGKNSGSACVEDDLTVNGGVTIVGF